MWALPDLFLFSDRRTDPAMQSLLAHAQKTQTPLWGCLVLLAWCWVLPSDPRNTRAPTLWVDADIEPCLMERKVCTRQYKRVLWALQRSQVLWNSWAEITYMEETKFCCQSYSGMPFQAHPQTWILWTAKQTLCSVHFRRSIAQCAGSEVTGILPLASMLLDQNLRKVVSACSPGTPADTPKESAKGTWRIQVHVTKFKSTHAVPMEKKVRLKRLFFRSKSALLWEGLGER